jgi:hypothetical protein
VVCFLQPSLKFCKLVPKTGAPPEDIGEEEEVEEEEEDIGDEDEMADFIVDEEDIDENGQPVRYILLFVWMSRRCI